MNTIKVLVEDHVIKVVLNRPEIHNAFSESMIQELTDTFRNLPSSVRCVLLSGEGKSFCAGADLKWMKSMANYTFEENQKDSEKLFEMFESIYRCPVPVIGKVQGGVFGGGLGLVAACDIVASQREAKFCFSEVRLGLVPAVISAFVLKKISQSQARQMMLTAQAFDEEKALEMGLVHFIGSDDEVDDYIQSQVDFILSNGPEALRDTKHLLDYVLQNEWEAVKSETSRVIAQRRASDEGQEGMKSFFEKRKPSWKF